MASLYEQIKQSQEAGSRVKPVTPIRSNSFTPTSIQAVTGMKQPVPRPVSEINADRLAADRERGVSLTQGTVDLVQEQRQSLSGIPVIGQFLTGTGPQGPSERLYPEGSMRQSLVEKGIVGFLVEGFQKKLNPTRAEVGEKIFTRYEKLADTEPDANRRLELAIQDVINESPGTAKSIADLRNPGVKLSEQEKEALFWTNTLEDAFAVLDAPVFVGSTKIPKNALLSFLKKTDDVAEIVPRLRMAGIAEDVANEVAPKIAKSTNEIQIARFIEDAKTATKNTEKPSLFTRIKENMATKLTPGKTNRFAETPVRQAPDQIDEVTTTIKRTDEVKETEMERFFRSTQGGKTFDEIKPDEVVPAFIREDLDTFVTKLGDEYQVIEGRTGQQIGDGGRTVAEAVQKAKSEVEAMGNERLSEFINNSPLSPRYTQVTEKAPEIKVSTQKDANIQIPKGVITADQLRLTDKAAARRLAKLERMANTSTTVDSFVDRTGITKPALDKTVQQQGYKDADQFFEVNKPRRVSSSETISRRDMTSPDTRTAPDDDEYYSLLGEQQAGDAFVLAAKKDEAESVVDNLRAVFADMKGIEVEDALKFTEEDLAKVETEYEFMMDALMDDPARALSKFANRFGELPEVNGKEFIQSRTGSGKLIRNSRFGKHGDDIVTELGFKDSNEAIKAFEAYKERRARVQEVFENMRQIRNSIRLAKQMDTFVEVNQKKLAAEFMKNRKALSAIVDAAERAGFRKGVEKGNQKYEVLVEKLRSRRNTLGSIKWRYSLSNAEMRKAQEFAQKEMNDLSIPDDPRFMTKEEFTEYSAKIEEYARDAELRRTERGIVKTIIEQKELKNTENLREVMGLPNLSEMTLEQLGQYENVLNKFRDGDEFLSKRTLEVIDRTALKGARTVRQVQEFLAKEIKRVLGRDVAPGELANLTADASDYLRWDTSLAESKPFYGFMVNRAQKHIMEGESNFLRIQERVLKLAEAAKKSRVKANKAKIQSLKNELKTTTDPDARRAIKKRMKGLGWRANVKQQVVPTYSRIINYLEARGDDKEMWWKTLTKEEQDYAIFARNYYNSAYNYLTYINEIQGSRYIDAYFTHVRKGFLEKWSDDGFVAALKNMWDAQKEDMAIANIIDSDTGRILPKSKFFQYTLKRTGEGEVSQNLTQVFLRYAKLLERKKMLDKMVPELDVYTSTLTPKELTQRGLEMDRTMKEFVNNYLNTKRGRKFNYGGIIKQSGPADIALRAGNTMVSFLDLGLNFTAGAASVVGEQVANFVALGNRGTLRGFKRRIWDTGMKRLVDPKAVQILKEAEPFIGRNVWTEIAEVDRPIFDKALQTMFGLFSQSSVEASKIYLLGSLTKEELQAGKISAQRLADLRLEAGRWRDLGESVKSIVGATSAGASFTKYKSWAIPIMRTTIKNVSDITAMLKKGEYKTALTAKQTKELMRQIEVTALAVVVGNMIAAEENDESPLGKLRNRIKQEALTILGGVDPTVFLATPRLYSWLQQLAGNLKELALLEEYKTDSKYGDEGDLKGLGGLKQQFLPAFIRQFIPSKQSEPEPKESATTSKLDKLNKLEKLESLEKLDKLDKLEKLEKLDQLETL